MFYIWYQSLFVPLPCLLGCSYCAFTEFIFWVYGVTFLASLIRNNIKIRNDMSFLIFLWFKMCFWVSKMHIMVWVFEIGFAGVEQILMTRLEVEDEHSRSFGCWYEIVNKFYFRRVLNKARLDPVVDVIYIISLSWVRISLETFNCMFSFSIN